MNVYPPTTITTPRLQLLRPNPAYAAELATLINQNLEHLRPWMAWAQEERTTEQQAESLAKAQARFDAGEDLMYLISLEGRLIGSSGLHRLDWTVPSGELGYWLAATHEGQGYATETAQALTTLAFETLHFERLEIRCDPRNIRSAAVPTRLGFKREALLKRHHRDPQHPEQLRDTLIFARWRQESIKPVLF